MNAKMTRQYYEEDLELHLLRPKEPSVYFTSAQLEQQFLPLYKSSDYIKFRKDGPASVLLTALYHEHASHFFKLFVEVRS